jgi:hypothetical protein
VVEMPIRIRRQTMLDLPTGMLPNASPVSVNELRQAQPERLTEQH